MSRAQILKPADELAKHGKAYPNESAEYRKDTHSLAVGLEGTSNALQSSVARGSTAEAIRLWHGAGFKRIRGA